MRDVIRRVMETAGHIIPVLLPLVPAVFLGIIVFAGTGHSTGTAKPDEYKVSAAKVDWDTFSLSDPGSGDGDDQAAEPEGTGAVNQEDGNRTFTDGTYRGSAQGYGGLVTVDVTVSGGRIESIEIVSAPGETDTFFNRAKGVIDSILMAQNTDVDVVSGATYSSNGIIAAVENALYGKTSRSLPSPGAASAKTGSAPSVAKVDESGSYKDGTYTGSAKGFGGQIKVQVTIKGGKIKTIKILSASGETSSYLNKAKSLLKRMVSRQSTNVDTVSGATYSSAGIIKAARSALRKARIKSDQSKNKTTKKKTSKKKTKKNKRANKSDVRYEDGVYTGTGQGYGGPITVSVTVKDGKISKVEINDASKETREFLQKARALTSVIVDRQTPDVDVISGATYSSRGIISAVKNALAKAGKKNSAGDSGQNSGDNENGGNDGNNAGQDKASGGAGNKTHNASGAGSSYQDGTYRGTGEGYEGPVTVDVTIKEGKIDSVEIVSREDDDPYFGYARAGVIPKVISGQTTAVDVVTGATYSSEGILQAIDQALEKARADKDGTGSDEERDRTGGNAEDGDSSGSGTDGTDKKGGQSGTGQEGQESSDVKDQTGSSSSGQGIENSADQTGSGTSGHTDQAGGEAAADSGSDHSGQAGNGQGGSSQEEAGQADQGHGGEGSTGNQGQDQSGGDKAAEDEEKSGSIYKDGTYSVTVTCDPIDYDDEGPEFRAYKISMDVTIKDDKITSISNVSGGSGYVNADKWYLNTAKSGMISKIVSKGSPDGVDVVSQATCSSKAIIEGCRKALSKAKN